MSIEYDKTTTEVGRSPGIALQRAGAIVAGTRLAHFEIERQRGGGAMGEVYQARDLALDRPVAIKVLGREIAENESLRERFYREARAQARIQHPNVCHIYYIGEQAGRLFFAMEFIEGESLHQLLAERGRLDPGEAVELCRQIACGLREAQRHGFTHRDIKPSNVMVDRHGTVKIVDFGIVKKTETEPGAELTAEKAVVGTPLYVSPEQARGDPVDFRSDIYSIGATLHELIAGEPPFRGPTAMKIIAQHLTDERPRFALPHRRKLKSGLLAIEALIDRMMAKRPERRFASYDELVAAMDAVSPTRVRPAGVFVRSFALAIDALLVFVVFNIPFDLLQSFLPAGDLIEVLASSFLFALYMIALVARSGRTIGKRLLEIEVVPLRGRKVGRRRAAVRFLVQIGPFYLAIAFSGWAELAGAEDWVPIVLVASCFVAITAHAIFVGATAASKRMFWDRLAGTQVRYIATANAGSR